tara:strand:+ start:119 stop:742 length:624 start_codon:yes stop_codon:yes gene_type:complete
MFNSIKNKLLKRRLNHSIKKADKIRIKDIESIKNTWSKLNKLQIYNYDELYNTCLYSSIVYNDISVLYDFYINTNNHYHANLYGRLLSMTIYEYLQDINKLLGKNLRQELEKNNLIEFVNELKIINKEYASIKNENQKFLKNIRVNSAAHKSKDSKYLVEIISENHSKELNKLALRTSEITNKLIQLTSKIISKITKDLTVKFEVTK